MNRYIISKGILKEKSKKELMRIIDNFQKERDSLANALTELVEKSEKYKWHDLRKNSSDLPQDDTDILCTNQHGQYLEGKGYLLHYDERDEVFEMETDEFIMYDVIAWKYIEPFEEVE